MEQVMSDDDKMAAALLRVRAMEQSHGELLAVLKRIVRGYDGPTVDIGTSVSAAIPAARAAIARAEAL